MCRWRSSQRLGARLNGESSDMNWRRGLFRLWILLSVLWVAGVVSLAWSDPWRVSAFGRPPTVEEMKECNNATAKPSPGAAVDQQPCGTWITWEPSAWE